MRRALALALAVVGAALLVYGAAWAYMAATTGGGTTCAILAEVIAAPDDALALDDAFLAEHPALAQALAHAREAAPGRVDDDVACEAFHRLWADLEAKGALGREPTVDVLVGGQGYRVTLSLEVAG